MPKKEIVVLELDEQWGVAELSEPVARDDVLDIPAYCWRDGVEARIKMHIEPDAHPESMLATSVRNARVSVVLCCDKQEITLCQDGRIDSILVIDERIYCSIREFLVHPVDYWHDLVIRTLTRAIATQSQISLIRHDDGHYEAHFHCGCIRAWVCPYIDQAVLRSLILEGAAAEAQIPQSVSAVTLQPARYAKPQLIGWSLWSVLRRLFVR